MNVLGHHHVAENLEAIAASDEFQRIEERVFGIWRREVRLPAITTEGDKVIVTFMLITSEAQRHDRILSRFACEEEKRTALSHDSSISGNKGRWYEKWVPISV